MKKNLLLYFLFLTVAIFPTTISAQLKKNVDSLLALLSPATEDTTYVNLYLDIADSYENNDPGLARTYYQKAAALAKKLNYTNGLIKQFFGSASTFMVEGNLDSMLYYNELALALSRKLNDSLNIGIALFNIGMAYREGTQFEKAIEYCLEGRFIMERKGNKKIEVQMNDALQILYNDRADYDKAIEFGEKAVKQSEALGMDYLLATARLNLTMSYDKKNLLVKAELLIRQVLVYAEEKKDLRIEATATQNLAGIMLRKGEFKKMQALLERSLTLHKQINSLSGEASVLRGLAVAHLQQKNFQQAKEYAERSLAMDKENNYKQEYASVARVLSAIHYAMHDVINGEKYDRESNDTLESMVRGVMSEQSANLEKNYEIKTKEVQISQLETEKKVQHLSIQKKNILNYILAGCALVIILISGLSYKNYKQKQALQQQRIIELETQHKLTATEAVLKGEEQERTRLAKDLHDGLGGMLSGIKYSFNTMKGNLIMTPENNQAFERSMDMLDSSIKEMRRVAHNMMPEALVKFGLDIALKDFCNDINQTGVLQVNYQSIGMEKIQLDQITAITIYRIVQELLNNTIKHAGAKTAIVQVSKTNDQLSVTVEDDGKGFDPKIVENSKGIGWSNIQNRVEFLKGKLDVHSLPDKGTSVLIEFRI